MQNNVQCVALCGAVPSRSVETPIHCVMSTDSAVSSSLFFYRNRPGRHFQPHRLRAGSYFVADNAGCMIPGRDNVGTEAQADA